MVVYSFFEILFMIETNIIRAKSTIKILDVKNKRSPVSVVTTRGRITDGADIHSDNKICLVLFRNRIIVCRRMIKKYITDRKKSKQYIKRECFSLTLSFIQQNRKRRTNIKSKKRYVL